MDAVAETDPVSAGDGTADLIGPTVVPSELTKDDIFHLLQNQRRRRVLTYLRNIDGRVTMRDIAEQVAAWENDTTVEALSSDERQRVYIALYQSHLPKLDESGVLTYNQQRGIVERTTLADQLDTYLDKEDGNNDGKEDTNRGIIRYYGAATLAGVLSTVASWAGLVTTSGLALATFITGLFAAVTIGMTVRERGRKRR